MFLFICAEASSNMSEIATLMPDDFVYSSLNETSNEMHNANLANAYNEKMRGIVESTTFNFVHNVNYNTNQMGYNNQNALAQEQNTYSQEGGLVGGDINNMIPSINNVAPFSTARLYNNFYSQESFNVGGQGIYNLGYGNNFNTDQVTQV